MVQYPRSCRSRQYWCRATDIISTKSGPCHRFLFKQWVAGVRCIWRRGARDHRWRGTLCGYGTLRRQTYPLCLVWMCVASAYVELSRAGSAAALQPVSDFQSFLSSISRLGALSGCRIGDRGDRNRIASRYFRCFFHDQAGYPAGISAAHADQVHLRSKDRADIYPFRQLDTACCGSHGGTGLWLILQSRIRVWFCGDRHDGH